MTVLEVGASQPHVLCITVHQVHKGGLTAGDMLGDGNRRIVARGDHNTALQLSDRDRLAGFNPHQRGTIEYRILGPGIAADRHQVVQAQSTQLHLLSQNISRHQFSQTCGRQLHIGVVLN